MTEAIEYVDSLILYSPIGQYYRLLPPISPSYTYESVIHANHLMCITVYTCTMYMCTCSFDLQTFLLSISLGEEEGGEKAERGEKIE